MESRTYIVGEERPLAIRLALEAVQNETARGLVNNKELLAQLREIEPGNWQEV